MHGIGAAGIVSACVGTSGIGSVTPLPGLLAESPGGASLCVQTLAPGHAADTVLPCTTPPPDSATCKDSAMSDLLPARSLLTQPLPVQETLPGLVLSATTRRTPDTDAPTGPSFPSPELVDAAGALFARHAWDPRRDAQEGRVLSLSIAPGCIALAGANLVARDRSTSARQDNAAKSLAAPDFDPLDYEDPWEDSDTPAPGRVITKWSARSRSRMVRALAELNWDPIVQDATGRAALVTLTYSGQWQTFAPSGRTTKRHLDALRKRSERAWGPMMCGIWKLEFQRRGAPHVHIYTIAHDVSVWNVCDCTDLLTLRHFTGKCAKRRCPSPKCENTSMHMHDGTWLTDPGAKVNAAKRPGRWVTYPEWLSHAWADIVSGNGEVREGHVLDLMDRLGLSEWDACELLQEEERKHLAAGTGVDYDEALRSSDPKRLAVYFCKRSVQHAGVAGGKEYQHIVPAEWSTPGNTPGRFWGYWGLDRATAVITLSPEDYIWVKRTLRRWQRAQGRTRKARVQRRSVATDRQWLGEVAEFVSYDTGEVLTGKVRYRTVTRRWSALTNAGLVGGWVLANDGPALASQLARALDRR